MKPLIFYIDDEPHNLTVFEASLPADWDVRTFSQPLQALKALETESPWVLVADQRMPGLTGVAFLELAKKLRPEAIRVIVTGFSDENLIVESVRKAQIFDYIKKPWEVDELEASLARAVELYSANAQAKLLQSAIIEREARLERQNKELTLLAAQLQESSDRETELRRELECWVPPFLLSMLQDHTIRFPIMRDIVGITFDVIEGSKYHGIKIAGKPLLSVVIQMFSEAILQHGGCREGVPGDSVYGHFGLWDMGIDPFQGALAAAQEFRVKLKNLSDLSGIQVECGISLHVAKEANVDIYTAEVMSPTGKLVQKALATSSIEIDLLHRMEKLIHQLPGSNIIMSAEFLSSVKNHPPKLIPLGPSLFKGQTRPVELFLIPSYLVNEGHIRDLRESIRRSTEMRQLANGQAKTAA